MTSKPILSFSDRLLLHADGLIRSLNQNTNAANRPNPADAVEAPALSESDSNHAAGLMRVNHTGEVCAQALYQGQALTARLTDVRDNMTQAAEEEQDHLAWCQERLAELDSRPSILDPLFYAASFGMGALAGAVGDKWFVR